MSQVIAHNPPPMTQGQAPAASPSARRGPSRSTPLASRGEPVVWLTGVAMAVCLAMIVGLLALTVVQGVRTFWPLPIDRVTLRSGTVLMGSPIREEAYDPSAEERAQIDALRDSPEWRDAMVDDQGRPIRRLYRVGNKEIRGQPFEWVPLHRIQDVVREDNAVMLERRQWGVWFGYPEAVVLQERLTAPEGVQPPAAAASGRVEDKIINESAAGAREIRRWTVMGEGDAAMPTLRRMLDEAEIRAEELKRLNTTEVAEINSGLERARLRLRQAEIDAQRNEGFGLSVGLWGGLLVGAIAALAGAAAIKWSARGRKSRTRSLAAAAALCVGVGLLLPVALESPWSGRSVSPQELAAARQSSEARAAELRARYDTVLARIRELEAEDARYRVIVREPTTGKFAPVRQTEPDEPMLISQIVRVVDTNDIGLVGKVGIYFDRWTEFLLDEPREANTEGGIFPVIFGTVLLTLLLSVAVVPLGVVAALYIREYAKQGLIISIVRIAVNNLAGVPSIVYGVFGLGFFCYSVGQFVDRGPIVPWSRATWWGGIAALTVGVFGAIAAGLLARARPGQHATRAQRWLGLAAIVGWGACVVGAGLLIAGIPMFHGFFEASQPSPVLGTKGMLWSALTLALLTLPVVIVATEEAIAAVPRTMREGSYGCGASKWQTIRRIVLPRAMPGVMTGMILAMARGAGEVAPLMLVGAVKLAPELLVSSEFPFIHVERSFMHLGFHIYDVGFQSPDAEAARPLVWTTTLVLIVIVLLLNLTAIRVRSQLRRRFVGGAF